MTQMSESCHREPVVITAAQLPFCCPPPATALWDMHPRVYLSLEKSGEATCPYCGARYRLDDRHQ